MATVVPLSSKSYTGLGGYSKAEPGIFWNRYPLVRQHLCRSYTGDESKWWIKDFYERFCDPPFEHALVLMCGNGWVERNLFDRGIAKRFSAFDVLPDLIEKAEQDKADRPIRYFVADANSLELPENEYDLIVNVAAMHHVQLINRLARILCHALKPTGVMVNTDYIGPHRNQYSRSHWKLVIRTNQALPAFARKDPLKRPDLGTMLLHDPTEAIHSDLTIETLSRYFTIFERHDAGGGIAYPILNNNRHMVQLHDSEQTPLIAHLLREDARLTEAGRVPPLFSYFIARPRKMALAANSVESLQRVEDSREARAEHLDGVYSIGAYIVYRIIKLVRRIPGARKLYGSVRFNGKAELIRRLRQEIQAWSENTGEAVRLTGEELTELQARRNDNTLPYFVVVRARMILLAEQGLTDGQIALRLCSHRNTVGKFRRDFIKKRIAGLGEPNRAAPAE